MGEEYKGQNRRQGWELCFNLDEPDFGEKVTIHTGLTFLSHPYRIDRTEMGGGIEDKFFIPVNCQYPYDLQPVADLTGPVKGRVHTVRYSKEVYLDRRKPNYTTS